MTLMKSEDPNQTDTIEIREISGEAELEEIYRIRNDVFVLEQRLTPNARSDPDDKRSLHYIARLDGQAVGTGRLTIVGPEGQIAWVAVEKDHRGKGIGWRIMEIMIERGEREGLDYIILNAQTHALSFYRRLGFEAVGQEFRMGGIPHRVMIRTLRPGGDSAIRGYFDQYNRSSGS